MIWFYSAYEFLHARLANLQQPVQDPVGRIFKMVRPDTDRAQRDYFCRFSLIYKIYVPKRLNGIHGCRPATVRWPRGPLKGPGWYIKRSAAIGPVRYIRCI